MEVDAFQFAVRRHVRDWMEFFASKKVAHTSTQTRWETPPQDCVKINVDASFNASLGH